MIGAPPEVVAVPLTVGGAVAATEGVAEGDAAVAVPDGTTGGPPRTRVGETGGALAVAACELGVTGGKVPAGEPSDERGVEDWPGLATAATVTEPSSEGERRARAVAAPTLARRSASKEKRASGDEARLRRALTRSFMGRHRLQGAAGWHASKLLDVRHNPRRGGAPSRIPSEARRGSAGALPKG
jgi:hypothetical protein